VTIGLAVFNSIKIATPTTTTSTEIYSHRALKRNVENIRFGNEKQSITNTYCLADGRNIGEGCFEREEGEMKSLLVAEIDMLWENIFLCVPAILKQSLSLSLYFMEK
jgi:hypothetical protein